MLDTQLQTEEARKYMLRDAAGGSVGSRAAKAAHNCAITPSFATRAPVINTLYDDFAVVQLYEHSKLVLACLSFVR